MVLVIVLFTALFLFGFPVGSLISAFAIRRNIKKNYCYIMKAQALVCLTLTTASGLIHFFSIWLLNSMFKAFQGGNSINIVIVISLLSIPLYIFCLHYAIRGFEYKPQNDTTDVVADDSETLCNKCHGCNAQLVNGAEFCTQCGHRLCK